jgi:hypothetical protein
MFGKNRKGHLYKVLAWYLPGSSGTLWKLPITMLSTSWNFNRVDFEYKLNPLLGCASFVETISTVIKQTIVGTFHRPVIHIYQTHWSCLSVHTVTYNSGTQNGPRKPNILQASQPSLNSVWDFRLLQQWRFRQRSSGL